MDLFNLIDNYEKRKREREQYLKDAPLQELEHQIKMAEHRRDIWAQAEKQRRKEDPYNYDYIRRAKQRRKAAVDDLEWLWKQVAKIT